MAVKHKQILRNGVDLRETQPILSKPYVPRNIQEVALGRLDKNSSQGLNSENVVKTHLVREVKGQLIVRREQTDRRYLLPWNWPENFEPLEAPLNLLDCLWTSVVDRVANQRYAPCLREAQAGRRDAMD